MKLSIFKCIIVTFLWSLIYLGSSYLTSMIVDSIRNDQSVDPDLFNLFGLLIAYSATIIYIKRSEKITILPKIWSQRTNLRDYTILTILITILLVVLRDPIINLSTLVEIYGNPNSQIVLESYVTNVNNVNSLIIEIVQTVFIAAICSEIVFRRYIFVGLLNQYNLSVAILLSSFLYAIVHIYSKASIPNSIGVFFVSIIASIIYFFTKNIYFPILLHMLLNMIYNLQSYFIQKYLKLIGFHKFNFYYWIFIILSSFVFVYLLVLLKKKSATSFENEQQRIA